MYHEERERRRLQEESRRQQAMAYQVPDIEMVNGGIEEAIIVEDDESNWDVAGEAPDQEVGADGGGVEAEVEEEL